MRGQRQQRRGAEVEVGTRRTKADMWWMDDGPSAMENWQAARAGAGAGALALAGVWAWAQGEPRARGEKIPSAVADPSTS